MAEEEEEEEEGEVWELEETPHRLRATYSRTGGTRRRRARHRHHRRRRNSAKMGFPKNESVIEVDGISRT